MRDLYIGTTTRLLHEFEECERIRRRFDPDIATLREITRAPSIHDQFKDILASNRSIEVLMNEQLAIRDTYRRALDALGGPAGLRGLAEQARATHAALGGPAGLRGLAEQARATHAALGGLLSAEVAQAQSALANLGVSDVLTEYRFRELAAFARPEHEALIAIGAAASRFEALSEASSFTRVGRAMDAAAGALSSDRLAALDYRPVIDPFFGDWARIDRLPQAYGFDPGARREVLEEIEADQAFLDVSADEAAALIEESSFDGYPIVLLGEPVGLVVTQDPDDVAARLIRRVERALRAKIARVLREKHGENWPQVLMPDRAQKWSEKRSEDAAHGLPMHDLIHYSEFAELAWIITQRWNDGFAGRVAKASKVTSRIQALTPHRNYEFHSRPITPEQLIGIVYAARELEVFLLDDGEDVQNSE